MHGHHGLSVLGAGSLPKSSTALGKWPFAHPALEENVSAALH